MPHRHLQYQREIVASAWWASPELTPSCRQQAALYSAIGSVLPGAMSKVSIMYNSTVSVITWIFFPGKNFPHITDIKSVCWWEAVSEYLCITWLVVLYYYY